MDWTDTAIRIVSAAFLIGTLNGAVLAYYILPRRR